MKVNRQTNFWNDLQKPFSVLAPMDGVTDSVFRQIIVETGKPDVFFTEFTNCDGLQSKGRVHVIDRLHFQSNEHPIVAQIWGIHPETFYTTAKEIKNMGFDGIDLNMGCPHRTITEEGACSALIKNPTLAAELIQATKEGSGGLPVSVKTRIGFQEENIDSWIAFLLRQDIAALTVHLRTTAELSKVPAHWEHMHHIVNIRKQIAPHTLLIGNGDVTTVQEGEEKVRIYGCDGIMYGTAIFTTPWLFASDVNKNTVSEKNKINIFLRHIRLFKQTSQTSETHRHFAILKKYCKIYINGFAGASELRERVMETQSLQEMELLVSTSLE